MTFKLKASITYKDAIIRYYAAPTSDTYKPS